MSNHVHPPPLSDSVFCFSLQSESQLSFAYFHVLKPNIRLHRLAFKTYLVFNKKLLTAAIIIIALGCYNKIIWYIKN